MDVALDFIECKIFTGFNPGSFASAQKHIIKNHPELEELLSQPIPELKSNFVDLFAAISIVTNVPFAFFEHPVVSETIDQV